MNSSINVGKRVKNPKKRRLVHWVIWLGFALVFISALGMMGATGGYLSAQQDWQRTLVAGRVLSLSEQYTLGLQDMQEQRYDLAQQRFEFVLSKDPNFPGVAEKLAEAIQIQSATATPSPIPATGTPTPTRDLRPVDALFTTIRELFGQGDWEGSVNAIVSLRQADSQYHVAEVDGMLYRSLRNRGLRKIREDGNLEGGIYDLTLAERIGPLDIEAITQRDLARYYMMGSSFWEVYPEQAVYYFGLVASAMPSMRDATGWTAAARYRAALIQYGDQLAGAEDWCSAQAQYELAFSYAGDADLQSTMEFAANKCNPPTDTPPPVTEIPTETETPTPTLVEFITPTATATIPATATTLPSATIEDTASPSIEPTVTPTTESTPTTSPTDTPVPTQEPSPAATDTQSASPTDLPTQTLSPTPETGTQEP